MCKSIRFIALVLLFFVIVPLVSQSATIEVMNTNDSGPGSLRQAIADANPAGGDDIVFNPSLNGELFLVNSALVIDKSLTITGLGMDNMAIENNGVAAPFIVIENNISDIVVTITDIEVRNTLDFITVLNNETLNIERSRYRGGGVILSNQEAAVLNVKDSIIELGDIGIDNIGANMTGGTGGVATIERTLINNNNSGVQNFGGTFGTAPGAEINIIDSTISNSMNNGITSQGAFTDSAREGQVNLSRSSVIFNGAGIDNRAGQNSSARGSTVNAVNTTIANNLGNGITNEGGDNASASGASFNCAFCTIANNDGYGVENVASTNGNPGQIDLDRVIIANNGDNSNTFNCDSNADFAITNSSKVTDNSCIITPVTLPSLELGPLQNNGGFTDTIAIGATSSAKDVVPEIECIDFNLIPVTNDQRQLVRPFNSSCDVGAFEYQPVGSITIEKETFPSGVRNIDFSTNNVPPSCVTAGQFTLNDGESITCPGLAADGTIYAFWESPVQPFNLFDIECVGNTNGLIPVIAGLGGIRFSLAGGDDVTCTFKNDVIPFNLNGVIPKAAGAKNFILFDGAQPNEKVDIYWGFVPQTEQLFDDSCPGIDIGIKNPRFLAEAVADSNGEIQYSVFVPGGAAGLTVIFQGVAQENCRVSNRIPVLFTDDN